VYETKVSVIYKDSYKQLIFEKYMRSNLYVMKRIQNQIKYSTTNLLNALLVNIVFPHITAKHYLIYTLQLCKIVAVRPHSSPHSALIALHMTVGSAAIAGIPFCVISNLVLG
jgi:hypothetical protein